MDLAYQHIVDALQVAAVCTIPVKRRRRFKVVPGWNEHVKELHARARSSFLLWARCGKPRHGEYHQQMTTDRATFKRALRQCKRQEAEIRADKLAQDLLSKDAVAFWKDVQTQSCMSVPLAETVGGVTGRKEIANRWADHYKELFNSVPNDGIAELSSRISERIRTDETTADSFSVRDVEHAIKQLKKKKSPGPDGLSSEHFLYADRRLHVILSICFNAFVAHGYLPQSVIFSCLVPVLKDKTGNSSDMSNYRPIALTSIVSKILERIVLRKSLSYLTSCDNQFGFKADHSTDLCIYALKETISYFLRHSTPVFVCFMDASKAFDKINHCTLFTKLLDRRFPLLFLRLLLFWYSEQMMCIRWGNVLSYSFSVKNGVRQGGVLSPVLFNVYVDDLSKKLNIFNNGCVLSNVMINHFFYADDLVLLCPSLYGLQKIIDVCSNYSVCHNISFNPKKTVCMAFLPRCLKLSRPFKLTLLGQQLPFKSQCKYLGVFLSSDSSDNYDLSRQLRSFYIRCNFLSRNFHECSPEVKCLLFNSFCCNIYAGHCWSNFTKSKMSKVVIAFNNSFRRFMSYPRSCSASAMFAFNRVRSFNEILRNSVYRFRTRLFNSNNSFISALVSFTMNSPLWQFWNFHLF